MEKLSAFYFSGTGNTLYIAGKLCQKLSCVYAYDIYDIADIYKDSSKAEFFKSKVASADAVMLAFPIYGSAPPIPMRAFVHSCGKLFSGKKVIIVETQYFFSGDGAASLGRTVVRYGGTVIGAEHFNMPNNLADCKIFSVKNGDDVKKIVAKADKRLEAFADGLLIGKTPKRGFRLLPHAVGYFCQRKFWRKGEAEKRTQLKVDPSRCVGCGLCAQKCPVCNIGLKNGKAVALGKCVLCYRCVNLCPRKAITLIGAAPPSTQYKGLKNLTPSN